ncbi:MAG: CAP domain-containing protein, partial [Chitinophagaceae bacterium]
AENVAFGASTGEDVVNMWKNSAGHRNNMLGKFSRIGIGVARDKKGQLFYTQVFSD